jgi:hypothetical protein
MAEVTILKEHNDETSGDELLEDININHKGVLFVTGTAGAAYRGSQGQGHAWMGVAIFLRQAQDPQTPWNDRQIIASDYTNEQQSTSAAFRCSATAVKSLPSGRYNLRVVRAHRLADREPFLQLDLVVLSRT